MFDVKNKCYSFVSTRNPSFAPIAPANGRKKKKKKNGTYTNTTIQTFQSIQTFVRKIFVALANTVLKRVYRYRVVFFSSFFFQLTFSSVCVHAHRVIKYKTVFELNNGSVTSVCGFSSGRARFTCPFVPRALFYCGGFAPI